MLLLVAVDDLSAAFLDGVLGWTPPADRRNETERGPAIRENNSLRRALLQGRNRQTTSLRMVRDDDLEGILRQIAIPNCEQAAGFLEHRLQIRVPLDAVRQLMKRAATSRWRECKVLQ